MTVVKCSLKPFPTCKANSAFNTSTVRSFCSKTIQDFPGDASGMRLVCVWYTSGIKRVQPVQKSQTAG